MISPGLLYFLLLFAGGLCYNKTENNLPPYGGGSENIYDRTWKEAGASGNEICGIRSISGRKSRRGREEPRASSAKQVPENTREGDRLEVFIYKDSKDRLIATTRERW